jgi:hypothetical protein
MVTAMTTAMNLSRTPGTHFDPDEPDSWTFFRPIMNRYIRLAELPIGCSLFSFLAPLFTHRFKLGIEVKGQIFLQF